MQTPDKLSLIRRPVVAVLLPAATTATAILVAWLAYYAPSTRHYGALTEELHSDIKKVEQTLNQDKKEHRRLAFAGAKIEYATRLDQLNAYEISQLNELSAKIQGNAKLIAVNRTDTHNITLDMIDPVGFYDLIESIEAEEHVDRVTIKADENRNNRYTLSLYLNKRVGIEP